MGLRKHEWRAALCQRVPVALLDGPASLCPSDRKVLLFDGQIATGDQANEVHRVGCRPRFVEIVDSPDQPALEVTPGAEVFDVQVAYSKNLRRPGRVWADQRPPLRPPVKRGAKKRKRRLSHVAMLQSYVGLHHPHVARRPLFEMGGGFDNVRQLMFFFAHESTTWSHRRWSGGRVSLLRFT